VRRRRSRGAPVGPPAPPSVPAPSRPRRPGEATGPPQRPSSEVDPIPVRRVPEPDGVAGKVYFNGPQRLPSRPLSRPHPADPNLPVYDRDYVRVLSELQKGATDHARAVALGKQENLPVNRRGDERIDQPGGSPRLSNAKAVFNELERQTAMDTALAKPDHAFVTQAEIVGVRLSDGTLVPIDRINRTLGRTRGRIADHLDMAPDGTYTLAENKRWTTLLDSYAKRGGVTGGGINRSSTLGQQLRRETNVFDYARRRSGATVIVRGETLDGRRVTTNLNPANYRGSTPTPYSVISGQ
jgi:hypothetical protein